MPLFDEEWRRLYKEISTLSNSLDLGLKDVNCPRVGAEIRKLKLNTFPGIAQQVAAKHMISRLERIYEKHC